MNWFFIALAAPLLQAFTNISDQYLVGRYASNTRSAGALVLFSSLIGIVVTLVLGLFISNIFMISFLDKILLITTGIITVLWVIFYFFALKNEEV